MQNKIFFHIVDIGNYINIIDEVLTKIKNSNLISNSEIFLYCNYSKENFVWLKKYDHNNIKLFFPNNLKENYEIPTLIELKNYCTKHDCNVLYLHCKGVTHNSICVDDWRNFMLYYNVEKWEECVNKLNQGYDVVGVNWYEKPQKHFSGNFWWATSRYIRSLPKIYLPSEINYKIQFNADFGYRQDAEFWIGVNSPKVYSMHQSNINHYHYGYPKTNYIGIKNGTF